IQPDQQIRPPTVATVRRSARRSSGGDTRPDRGRRVVRPRTQAGGRLIQRSGEADLRLRKRVRRDRTDKREHQPDTAGHCPSFMEEKR
ncbi:unnamed protein product, partial [Nesidiocoris tenuis]